jgi:hypothetical protein
MMSTDQTVLRAPTTPLRALALACCAAALACSAPAGESSATETRVAPSVRTSAVCSVLEHGDVFEAEVYRFSAMNNKLRYYPDLAAAIGVSEVTDCESAREYVNGYARFSEAHPDFDLEQPYDDTQPVEPPMPADPSGETEKVFRGATTLRNPVVQIQFTSADGKTSSCSGTFIAKNWILTAAHCTTPAAINHCIKAGIPLTPFDCEPQWTNYDTWTINHKITDGTTSRIVRLTRTGAIAYVHPDWVGREPPFNPSLNNVSPDTGVINEVLRDLGRNELFEDHDIALLYFPDDTVLYPEVEKDGALRVSTIRANATWPMTFYGYGQSNDGSDLRTSVVRPTFTVPGKTIRASSRDIDSALCPGDSGGPLVRSVTMQTNAGIFESKEVIVGVASTRSTTEQECRADSPDPQIPGPKISTWTSLHRSFRFIEDRIRRWNGNVITERSGFSCRRPSVQNDVEASAAECWGKPCTSQQACGGTAFCSRPGSIYASCPTCAGSSIAGCGCIVGQCLPLPPQ